MNQVSSTYLYPLLADYKLVSAAQFEHLNLEDLLSKTQDIYLLDSNLRRQIYLIDSSVGSFFLKLSHLKRSKDKYRFLLLPWRISTEWRNLLKLNQKNVPAANPVLFGYKGRFPCQGFFLLTEKVQGGVIDCTDTSHLLKLADYISFLHAQGVFHRDLHPENILINSQNNPVLIDAQEVYFFPWLPRRLKMANLGQLWRHIRFYSPDQKVLEDFLKRYNAKQDTSISAKQINKIADRYQEKYYRSRSKRCFKNSTEFQVIKNHQGIRGFKRREFQWGVDELHTALAKGKYIKDKKLIAFENICIKINTKRLFHKDRCLNSWKMARALEVRGIKVPQALAYYNQDKNTYFLSQFYKDSLTLNNFLFTCLDQNKKKESIQRLAEWLRIFHSLNIWQRDFKSSNVLVLNNQFIMVDLEGVKIRRRLSWRKKTINLAQLNASISNILTLKDRLRFFHLYCGENLPTRKRRRKAYQKIWKITQGKNTLPFGLDLKKLYSSSLILLFIQFP